ncbi:type II secretion system protein [Rahnella sp. SL6]|nr:type II secretion system protein [Rahnella perminowiae]
MPKVSNSKGFTLLEMIVVMGIMGLVFTSFALFKKKQIESVARENLTNIIANEVHGMLQFINRDEIQITEDSDADGEMDFIVNPLFDRTISTANEKGKTYGWRVEDQAFSTDPKDTDHFIQWDNTLSRGYFTSHRCYNTGNKKVADKEFKVEDLACNQPANNQDKSLVLERVDLVGDEETRTIDRVDFYVSFHPGINGKNDMDKFTIENYATAFSKAFTHYDLAYQHADYIYRREAKGTDVANFGTGWKLLKTHDAKTDDEAVPFGSMVSYLDKIDQTAAQLGVRFSFKAGLGKVIKPDGLVGVDKLCWNLKENMMTHCLEVEDGTGRNNEEGVMHLTAKDANNQTVTGTLMANVIFEGEAFDPEKGNIIALMTSPVVSYQSFGNKKDRGTNDVIIDDPDNYDKSVTDEPGYIKIPVQKCPLAPPAPGNPQNAPRVLYPRLAAAISSIVADVGKQGNAGSESEGGEDFSDFSNSENNRTTTKGVLDHLSGVAVQVNLIRENDKKISPDDYWVISATSGVFDNISGKGVSVINPSSLSVVLTSWCSSIKQPAAGADAPMPPY